MPFTTDGRTSGASVSSAWSNASGNSSAKPHTFAPSLQTFSGRDAPVSHAVQLKRRGITQLSFAWGV